MENGGNKDHESYEIILASGSSRRREILTQIGAKFCVKVSDCDETISEKKPETLVLELSMRKAAAVARDVTGPAVIIGADTVVSLEDEILGKPKDKTDAVRMLGMLSGRTHFVYTGVCILRKEPDGEEKMLRFAERSGVHVVKMNEKQIQEYTDTPEPYDKAGAYAVQGLFAPYIEGIEGDYYNIVGLPVSGIYQRLYEDGIDLRTGGVIV